MRRIVGEQFERATTLLTGHRDALNNLATDLLKAESLDGTAVRAALTPAAASAPAPEVAAA